MNDSRTPRSDYEASISSTWINHVVPVEFSRQLETELADAMSKIEQMDGLLGAIERSHDCNGDGCEVCYQLLKAGDILDKVRK